MNASLISAHIAPKKANLMAQMVRGLAIPTAVELLRKTQKKSARIIEDVIHSAMANASHNANRDPQMMVVKEIVVNQGTSMRRGVPMARGRVRPIRKLFSHIHVTLGMPGEETVSVKKVAKKAQASEITKDTPKKATSSTKKVATKKPRTSSKNDASISSSTPQ